MKRYLLLIAMFFLLVAVSSSPAADRATAGAAPDPSQVKDLQERILDDQEILPLIMALQNDPEMLALLSDPKVLKAVQAGDLGALLNDPRIMKLLDNPQVKEIGKRLDKDAEGKR